RMDESWRSHLARLRRFAGGRGKDRAAYRVLAQAINAADYGAPQKRYRGIFIGIASEFGDDWSFPAPTHSQEALVWAKHVERGYWDRHGARPVSKPSSDSEAKAINRVRALKEKPRGRPWNTVRDAIGDLPAPNKRESIAGHWQHLGATEYTNHTGS